MVSFGVRLLGCLRLDRLKFLNRGSHGQDSVRGDKGQLGSNAVGEALSLRVHFHFLLLVLLRSFSPDRAAVRYVRQLAPTAN